MKYLGIDYGEKRIGLAISDDNGKVAFPLSVVLNDEKIFVEISKVVEEKKIESIVLGESLNFKGEKNFIMKEIEDFSLKLKQEFSLPVIFEPEFLSSVQALKMGSTMESLDAGAATVILQAFLDKRNHQITEADKKNSKLIDFEDFAKLDLRVGKILSAEKIPDTDKLLKLEVDFGEGETRQVISGIAEYFGEGENLAGLVCLFVVNLKPRKIKGFESQAMIVAVKDGDKLALFVPSQEISVGSKAS